MRIEDWLGEDNKLGIDIWKKKYQRNNETFDEWLHRVSGGDANLKQLIKEKKFLFAGRILSNRGVDSEEEKTTLSNCYVITPPDDSIESIYNTCKKLARTYSYGGGCGIDISKLAPSGARVRNQAKSTSGAVSFMDTFSQVTEQIGQNGRRGALMISMDCTHPDIESFIKLKSDLNKVNYANISIRVSDDFMRAVEEDKDWECSFTRKETGEVITKTYKAKDLFELIAEYNHKYAEPGVLFWDRISNWNMLSNNKDFKYAGVNPCAEEPLPAGGSCLLGSLNLAAFVENGKFDSFEFILAVKTAVKALDKVLDEGLEKHPLAEQQNSVRDWRQIGLGVMGIADMLIKMGITYGSDLSIEFCKQVGELLIETAIDESVNLAITYGAYPKYSTDVRLSDFFIEHSNESILKKISTYGIRHSQLLTIAPTGTISTMLGISGGIEPIFANSYNRTTKSLHGEDVTYKVYTPIVKEYMDKHNVGEDELPNYFVTSHDIPIKSRIDMQGAWQHYIDASISSTVNLPNSATVDDVKDVYMYAWKKGLKGVTVYRDGCERTAILDSGSDKPKRVPKSDEKTDHIGLERHLNTGCGSLHICAFFDKQGNLKNTYLSKGSTGGCNNFMIGLSRAISLAARGGIGIDDIVDQLKSSGSCPSYAVRKATKNDVSKGSSCPVAIGIALRDMWEEINNKKLSANEKEVNTDVCPQCGGSLKHEMGCITCPNCGYSKCG